jgi:hypothetical protein
VLRGASEENWIAYFFVAVDELFVAEALWCTVLCALVDFDFDVVAAGVELGVCANAAAVRVVLAARASATARAENFIRGSLNF